MRRLVALAVLATALVIFAAPAGASMARPQPQRESKLLHRYLGGNCTKAEPVRHYRPVCAAGRVTAYKHGGTTTIQEAGTHLRVTDVLPSIHRDKGRPVAHIASDNQSCTDTRVKVYEWTPAMKGLGYGAWLFRVNSTLGNNIQWSGADYNAPGGQGGLFAYEVQFAADDWMGYRRPNPPLRQHSGGACGWDQDQTPNRYGFNQSGMSLRSVGDTTARASLLPNCFIGDANTGPNSFGVADGINAVVAGAFHHTLMADGRYCDDVALAVTQIDINADGWITEADISVNINGAHNLSWCTRLHDTSLLNCSRTYLINHPHVGAIDNLLRHEIGHVIGLDHPCTCPNVLMSTTYDEWQYSPLDIGLGERNAVEYISNAN